VVTHFVGYQNDVTAREEAALHEAQLRGQLSSTLERVTDGFVIFDRNLNDVRLNTAAARIAGLRPAELLGRNLLGTFPDLQDSDAVQAIVRARDTGTSQRAISEMFGRWADITAYPGEDGVSVVFLRDVTERQQTQERLRSSEETFNTIFQACPVAIIISRASDQQYIVANPAFVRQSGYSLEDVTGRRPQDLNIWANPHEFEYVAQMLQEHGAVHDHEVQFRLKSGMVADAAISVVPVMLQGERCMVSLVRDITSEKLARQQLEASEAQYRTLAAELQRTLDLSLDLITTIGPRGHFVTMSAASRQILGYAPEELIGRSFRDFVHPDAIRPSPCRKAPPSSVAPVPPSFATGTTTGTARWCGWNGRR